MSKSIRLSKKYGVNPTMGVCAWCGDYTGEMALLGRLPNDAEAPHNTILSYEPCDKCKKAWTSAIVLIEVSTVQPADKRPPIQVNGDISLYPTFRHAGITEGAAKKLGIDRKLGERALIEDEAFEQLFGHDE